MISNEGWSDYKITPVKNKSTLMNYFEAPNNPEFWPSIKSADSLFIAGSITGTENNNWQSKIIDLKPITFAPTIRECYHVFNPRRENYDGLIPGEEFRQIHWEYHTLKHCDHILFWFASETLAPITLFELGSALNTHDHSKIHIGIHPNYARKNDVIIQTELRNNKLSKEIVYSLEDLAAKVIRARLNS